MYLVHFSVLFLWPIRNKNWKCGNDDPASSNLRYSGTEYTTRMKSVLGLGPVHWFPSKPKPYIRCHHAAYDKSIDLCVLSLGSIIDYVFCAMLTFQMFTKASRELEHARLLTHTQRILCWGDFDIRQINHTQK